MGNPPPEPGGPIGACLAGRAPAPPLPGGGLPGARVRCPACDSAVDAHRAVVEETVRFEGDSNPDDEQILLAITLPCTHRGLFRAAFGPNSAADDGEVLRATAETAA